MLDFFSSPVIKKNQIDLLKSMKLSWQPQFESPLHTFVTFIIFEESMLLLTNEFRYVNFYQMKDVLVFDGVSRTKENLQIEAINIGNM